MVIVPLLPSLFGFFFVFGHGVSFLVGSSILLLMVVQQLVAVLVLSYEEMSARPSTVPSWKAGFLILPLGASGRERLSLGCRYL